MYPNRSGGRELCPFFWHNRSRVEVGIHSVLPAITATRADGDNSRISRTHVRSSEAWVALSSDSSQSCKGHAAGITLRQFERQRPCQCCGFTNDKLTKIWYDFPPLPASCSITPLCL